MRCQTLSAAPRNGAFDSPRTFTSEASQKPAPDPLAAPLRTVALLRAASLRRSPSSLAPFPNTPRKQGPGGKVRSILHTPLARSAPKG